MIHMKYSLSCVISLKISWNKKRLIGLLDICHLQSRGRTYIPDVFQSSRDRFNYQIGMTTFILQVNYFCKSSQIFASHFQNLVS